MHQCSHQPCICVWLAVFDVDFGVRKSDERSFDRKLCLCFRFAKGDRNGYLLDALNADISDLLLSLSYAWQLTEDGFQLLRRRPVDDLAQCAAASDWYFWTR